FRRRYIPVNENHPFAQWLLNHAVELKSQFPGLFERIVTGLAKTDAEDINKALDRLDALRVDFRYKGRITQSEVKYRTVLS
ncbi:MAG: hypothetical protein AAF126_22890, partial [Chloroflexota bacterium]